MVAHLELFADSVFLIRETTFIFFFAVELGGIFTTVHCAEHIC